MRLHYIINCTRKVDLCYSISASAVDLQSCYRSAMYEVRERIFVLLKILACHYFSQAEAGRTVVAHEPYSAQLTPGWQAYYNRETFRSRYGVAIPVISKQKSSDRSWIVDVGGWRLLVLAHSALEDLRFTVAALCVDQ
jgi:hypothetical protein